MYSFVPYLLVLIAAINVIADTDPTLCKSCKCGKRRYYEGEMYAVAGANVDFRNEYSWLTQIYHDKELVCAGTLYNSRWIITAAHCLQPDVQHITVSVLSYYRNTGYSYHVAEKKVHPRFNTPLYANDIGLIKLIVDVKIGDEKERATTICFPPNRHENFVGKAGIVVGWGYYDISNTVSHEPKEALNVIISLEECEKRYESQNVSERLSHNVICAGMTDEIKVTCKGDSGGPFTTTINDQQVLLGVVSWGKGNCGERHTFPMVYTRISSFVKWIKSIVGDYCRCDPICINH